MATDDFFRARHDQMIDLRHALAVWSTRMPWSQIEALLAPVLAHRDRKGRPVEGADLFGPSVAVAGAGVSNAGRPRLPIRLMVALLYLKHAYNESDESVVVRWSQDVYFQFFSGQVYFDPVCRATRRRSADSGGCWVRPASSNCSRPPLRRQWPWASQEDQVRARDR